MKTTVVLSHQADEDNVDTSRTATTTELTRVKARSHTARRRTSTSMRQRMTPSVVVRCRTANHMHRHVNDMQI